MANNSLVLDGEKIATLRKAKGWNRSKLAAATHNKVSVETIGRIERKCPCYPDTAAILAAALGVRVEDLLPPPLADESAFDGRNRPPAEGIAARIDLRIWNGEGTPPGGFSLADPTGALPLKEGDLARIEVAIDRPVYAYLLWIDAQGEVTPIYPWVEHDWDSCPFDETPVEQIQLPEDGSEAEGDAYSIRGPEGMETVVLLLSEPGPAEFDFRSGLPEFPRQEGLIVPSAVARFEYPSARPALRTRGVRKRTKRISDPVFQIHNSLRKSLGPYFTKILAISFPNAG